MKVVVITGASSGLGKVIAQRLLPEYEVHSISRTRGEGIWHECDLSNRQETLKVLEELPAQVDYLINNAARFGASDLTPMEEWDKKLEINLTAPLILSLELHNRGASVINIASTDGINGCYEPSYCVSKAGLINLTKSLANFMRINCVAPGGIGSHGVSPEMVTDAVVDMMVGEMNGEIRVVSI